MMPMQLMRSLTYACQERGFATLASMPPKRKARDACDSPLKRPAGISPARVREKHGLDDSEKNILIEVQKRQMDKLDAQDAAALLVIKENISNIEKVYGKVPVASLCSGSNVAFLVFLTLAIVLGAGQIDNLFDVDRDVRKQRWLKEVINKSFGKRCVFQEMSDMGDTHAPCAAHGNRKCKIPSCSAGPFIVSCGFRARM